MKNGGWVVLAMVLAACGGSGTVPDARELDAEAPDAEGTGTCDPLAQTGCGPGLGGAPMKCTWIVIFSTSPFGIVGCADPRQHLPAGPIAEGQPCVWGPDGETTGYDNCANGNLCVVEGGGSVCRPICAVAASACPAPASCVFRQGMFVDVVPELGVCQ